MTNEEIREKHFPPEYIASKYYLDKLIASKYYLDKLEAVQIETRKEERAMILENDNAWNLVSVLAKVTEAAEILMSRDYDGHGWELISTAIERSKEIQTKLNSLK